jgi:hypothetical protein
MTANDALVFTSEGAIKTLEAHLNSMTLLSTKLAFNTIVRIVVLTIIAVEVPPKTVTAATSKTPVHRRASTTSRHSIGCGIIFPTKFLLLFVADQLVVELGYDDRFRRAQQR